MYLCDFWNDYSTVFLFLPQNYFMSNMTVKKNKVKLSLIRVSKKLQEFIQTFLFIIIIIQDVQGH